MTTDQTMRSSTMWQSIFGFVLISVLFSNHVQARNTTLRGQVLKTALQGRVLSLNTKLGALPIRYSANGTMSGRSSQMASVVGFSSDRGRWWVSGSKLCQRWQKLFDKKTICYRLSRSGNRILWSGGGRSGSARLSN